MELGFAITAFVAGILTVLAPCMVPVLPILVGGTAGNRSRLRPLIITGSLMLSVVLFTLLVRASTEVLPISTRDFQVIAGFIILIFGIFTLFPEVWDWISLKAGFSSKSNRFLAKFAGRGDFIGDVLVGTALGPVFTSCSPTYAIIVSLVIGGELVAGSIYLILYAIGLGIMLLLIAYAGQAVVKKLGWATDPKGVFKRIIGALFILVGLAIVMGWDKQIETWLLERGFYDPIADIENNLAN
mgnify:CR=1 FL=1